MVIPIWDINIELQGVDRYFFIKFHFKEICTFHYMIYNTTFLRGLMRISRWFLVKNDCGKDKARVAKPSTNCRVMVFDNDWGGQDGVVSRKWWKFESGVISG